MSKRKLEDGEAPVSKRFAFEQPVTPAIREEIEDVLMADGATVRETATQLVIGKPGVLGIGRIPAAQARGRRSAPASARKRAVRVPSAAARLRADLRAKRKELASRLRGLKAEIRAIDRDITSLKGKR